MTWDLMADIGGTNMRLATLRNGETIRVENFATGKAQDISRTFNTYCNDAGSSPDRVVVAAAGIVDGDKVTLTNTGTSFDRKQVADACGCANSIILNDFEAAAWTLADVSSRDVRQLQGTDSFQREARVIIGPGTGLGVGALVFDGDAPVVVKGEGGHVRISPDTDEERACFKALLSLWPDVGMGDGEAIELEAVVSGTGLPYFYRAIAKVHDKPVDTLNAANIFNLAKAETDEVAVKAVDWFTKYLGQAAGDMGVIFAAKGGVFICGGVAISNPWIFEKPVFIEAFNRGGRHTEFRRGLPVYLFTTASFGLKGIANYLMHRG